VKYDAIVIGGGHNGLIAAAYLARAGRKVLVLERRHLLGGAAVTEEVFPGFHFSVCSYVVSLLRPEIIRDLDLPRHGLEILPLDGTFTPMPSGDYLWRVNDHAKTRREIARHSKLDAEAYDEYGKAMVEMARFVKPILNMTPPDPMSLDPRELRKLLFLGKRFRALPDGDRYNQVQLMTMSAIDFLDQWFETDVLKATMSASGIIGTFQGVRSPGTAYVLLHHYMGEIDGAFRSWGFARGGTGAISNAIAAAAREAGVEIRTEAPVARITVKNSQASGVVLANGDELSADLVLSSVDPNLTFLKFMDADRELPAEFVQEIRRYKYRGSSGKVNLALDALPNFTCMPGEGPHLRGAISISPGVDYMERAYDQAKYGEFSRRPYMDMVIPTLTDPSIAPPGKHILSCFVQYAPYHLKGRPEGLHYEQKGLHYEQKGLGYEQKGLRYEQNGLHYEQKGGGHVGADPRVRPVQSCDWDDQRESFGDTVIDTIAEYAPNIRDIILHRQVLTPLDLERDFGLTEGNIFQGELTLEQLFFARPVPGWAQYKTPVRNLWMCGSATHPGGGIMGAPGRNAALRILGQTR
jgi:phytoene dehydrogenase-like protein